MRLSDPNAPSVAMSPALMSERWLSWAHSLYAEVPWLVGTAREVAATSAQLIGQADANTGHAFGIFMDSAGALHSLLSFRRRLPWALGLGTSKRKSCALNSTPRLKHSPLNQTWSLGRSSPRSWQRMGAQPLRTWPQQLVNTVIQQVGVPSSSTASAKVG